VILAFIEATMGPLFRSLLHFYEAHAVLLNLIVLTYGLVMYVSWLNLVRIYRYLVVAMAKRIHLDSRLSAKSSVDKVAELIAVPWEEAVQASRFPLIGSQVMLLPMLKSAAAVEKALDRQELIGHALQVLNGTHPSKIQPTFRKMWSKQVDAKRKKVATKNAKR
jgi:hypothetical protein